MKQIIIKIAVCIFLISSLNVHAEEHREGGREHREVVRERHVFVAHDFRHFNREERQLWRGGHWNNTCFGGRCGWWWFAEGQWFFYANRVGPYPVMVSDVVYVEQAPVVVEPQAPVMVAPPAPAPTTVPPQQSSPTWYYCASSKSYYPYVASCPEGWKAVPAQPAPPAPQ